MNMLRIGCVSLAVMMASAAFATPNDLRSIAGMQQHYRVLIVFTPSLTDARLAMQRAIVAQLAVEASRRDLVFVQADTKTVIGANDKPYALRRRFNVPALAYRTVLIDKSGKVVLASGGPIQGATIIRKIDAAPRAR